MLWSADVSPVCPGLSSDTGDHLWHWCRIMVTHRTTYYVFGAVIGYYSERVIFARHWFIFSFIDSQVHSVQIYPSWSSSCQWVGTRSLFYHCHCVTSTTRTSHCSPDSVWTSPPSDSRWRSWWSCWRRAAGGWCCWGWWARWDGSEPDLASHSRLSCSVYESWKTQSITVFLRIRVDTL